MQHPPQQQARPLAAQALHDPFADNTDRPGPAPRAAVIRSAHARPQCAGSRHFPKCRVPRRSPCWCDFPQPVLELHVAYLSASEVFQGCPETVLSLVRAPRIRNPYPPASRSGGLSPSRRFSLTYIAVTNSGSIGSWADFAARRLETAITNGFRATVLSILTEPSRFVVNYTQEFNRLQKMPCTDDACTARSCKCHKNRHGQYNFLPFEDLPAALRHLAQSDEQPAPTPCTIPRHLPCAIPRNVACPGPHPRPCSPEKNPGPMRRHVSAAFL